MEVVLSNSMLVNVKPKLHHLVGQNCTTRRRTNCTIS